MNNINITKDVWKAETVIRRIRKRADEAIDKVTLAWLKREAGYIEQLPEETKRMLRTAGVIGTQAPKFDDNFTLDPNAEENKSQVVLS